ncbi:MAG: chemotaxis protein CheW [Geminicoccaceae bacterium]
MSEQTLSIEPSRDALAVSSPSNTESPQDWSQYVTFTIDDRFYGIEITKVREIKGWTEPTELPNAPHAMRGVLNLRGVVVPIFDLRCRFGQRETQASEAHVVIIVALGDRLIGILVDAVSDILTLEPGEVLPMPEMDACINQRFLAGLVAQDERLVALLKLEELFDIGSLPSDCSF